MYTFTIFYTDGTSEKYKVNASSEEEAWKQYNKYVSKKTKEIGQCYIES